MSKEIIEALMKKDAHINEIASMINNHPTTVNRHIRQLESLGIVEGRLTQEDCPTICKRYSLKFKCFKVEYTFCSDDRKNPPTVEIEACC